MIFIHYYLYLNSTRFPLYERIYSAGRVIFPSADRLTETRLINLIWLPDLLYFSKRNDTFLYHAIHHGVAHPGPQCICRCNSSSFSYSQSKLRLFPPKNYYGVQSICSSRKQCLFFFSVAHKGNNHQLKVGRILFHTIICSDRARFILATARVIIKRCTRI